MLGQGLIADETYLEVIKCAGFPQAGSWVLGTMGGILAGRYGLGPLLHAPVDAMLPEAMADPEMTERVANTTGAFIGGNLGGALGYNLSGQRPADISPGGILRSAAGMTPTGVYDHPDEIPTWRNLRRKTAGIGAGVDAWEKDAAPQDLSHAIPAFGSWLVPTMGGILAGATLGDLAGPELAHLTPEGTPEAGQHIGRVAGGLLGGTAGSMLGYKLNETEEAPDVTPVGITSIAAGVPVHAEQPNVDLLSGVNRPMKTAFRAVWPWALGALGAGLAGSEAWHHLSGPDATPAAAAPSAPPSATPEASADLEGFGAHLNAMREVDSDLSISRAPPEVRPAAYPNPMDPTMQSTGVGGWMHPVTSQGASDVLKSYAPLPNEAKAPAIEALSKFYDPSGDGRMDFRATSEHAAKVEPEIVNELNEVGGKFRIIPDSTLQSKIHEGLAPIWHQMDALTSAEQQNVMGVLQQHGRSLPEYAEGHAAGRISHY